METIEGNKVANLLELRAKTKLIAQFNGWDVLCNPHREEWPGGFRDCFLISIVDNEGFQRVFRIVETAESAEKMVASAWTEICISMNYHESWGWLMPVVEKIEDLTNKETYGVFSVRIENSECRIIEMFPTSPTKLRMQRMSSTKINAVWLCVVAFIEWYNQNKS